jgi:hypothetical protein
MEHEEIMSDIEIEKLVLKVAGLDELQGKRLAEQLAASLEQISPIGDQPVRMELVRLRIQPAAGASAESMARQITTELARKISRS